MRRTLLAVLALMVAGCRPAAPAVDLAHAQSYLVRLADTIGSRPVGSRESVEARAYLVSELEKLGFSVRVQQALAVNPALGLTAPVANIIATKDGSRRDAIALISHHDSVPEAMGALDAGLGVAAVLESARQLVTQPLRHSLLVIITDAEELGLLGARAVMNDAEVVERVRAFLNFDGTGAAGPALLFEVGTGRGTPLDAWSEGAAMPEGASYTTEIYRRLPNDTDFSIFKRLNASGLNFAAVGDSYAYHTDRDVAARVSPATLHHTIVNTISTVRALDARDIEGDPTAAPTYFDLGGYGAIVYGPNATTGIAIVAVILGGIAWLRLTRQLWRSRRLAGLLSTAVWAAVTVAGTLGAMIGAVWALRAVRAELTPWYASPLGFLLLVTATGITAAWIFARLAAILPRSIRPDRDPSATWWAALPLWIGAGVFLQRSAPTAAYLVTLPLMAAGVLVLAAGASTVRLRVASLVVLGVGAFFGLGDLTRLLTFMVPLFGWLPIATPVWLYPAVLAASGLLVAPPLAAALAGLTPPVVTPVRVGMALGFALLVTGFQAFSASAYTAERPERRTARYVQDDVKGEVWWEIGGLESAPNLIGNGPEGARWERVSDAPSTSVRLARLNQPMVFRTGSSVASAAPAEIRAALSRVGKDGASVELSIAPHGNLVAQIVLPPGLVPSAASIAGVVTGDRWSATYVAPPASGLTVTLAFDRWTSAEPPQILVALTTVGLPGGSGRLRLPDWLPKATATWRARSIFISEAKFN
jgi:hypothetical protein